MAFWTQLMLLLWKNFLYRKRQPVMSSRVGRGWGGPRPSHSPSLFCPRRSNSWWSCCGRSFSSSSWWPFAIPIPHSNSMNVRPPASRALGLGLAVVTLCTGAPVRTRSTDRMLELWLRGALCHRGWELSQEPHTWCPCRSFSQQAAALSGHHPLAPGPHLQREQHLLPVANPRRGVWRPQQLQGLPVNQWEPLGRGGQLRLTSASSLLSVSRVSRLLADARTVLGGPSAHRMLASLRKLMPILKAARTARASEKAGLWQAGLGSAPPPDGTAWSGTSGTWLQLTLASPWATVLYSLSLSLAQ